MILKGTHCAKSRCMTFKRKFNAVILIEFSCNVNIESLASKKNDTKL